MILLAVKFMALKAFEMGTLRHLVSVHTEENVDDTFGQLDVGSHGVQPRPP